MLGFFYYSKFQDKYLLTNDAGRFAFLSEVEFGRLINLSLSEDTPIYQELEEKGFVYSCSKEEYIRDHIHLIRDNNRYLFSGTNLFIIAVTNACNNRCVYCQANGLANARNMDKEVAEQALQRISECSAEEITIEFQGGEPLLNFPIIRYFVERARIIMPHKTVQFAIVSNLGLLNDEIIDFLKENRISISTSLDGPVELHDSNRPDSQGNGTYDNTVNGRKRLAYKGIVCGAIQTTTRKSLTRAKEIVREYVERGYEYIFLRPLSRLGAAARNWDLIGYSAEEYLVFYRRALQEIIEVNREGKKLKEYYASIFLSKMFNSRGVNYMELRSPCGAGLGQVAITANGNVYTCDEGRMMAEAGDESFLIGNVFKDSYSQWIQSSGCQAVCSASLLDTLPGCCDCVFKPYCGVCPVVNYALHGNISHVNPEKCKINKGIMSILLEYITEGDPFILDLFMRWGEEA